MQRECGECDGNARNARKVREPTMPGCYGGGECRQIDARENVGTHRGGCAMVSEQACDVTPQSGKQ